MNQASPSTASNDLPQSTDQAMNVDKFIAEIMGDLKANRIELPTLPQVAIKISKTVENQNSCVKDVARIVSKDPALCARIIQVANSPLVRGNNKIDNVHSAITRMGSSMVKNIVTAFLVKQLFRTKHKMLQHRMIDIWNHSAHVAAISHVLAKNFSTLKADEVMLAGLLHDIGKLPILAKARKINNLEENQTALDTVIKKLHPALGKAILQAWNFEPSLVNVAAEHERIHRDSKVLDHTDIVLVANLHSFIGKKDAPTFDWNDIPAMNKLNLDADTSVAVLKEAHEEIADIQKLFTN